MKGAPRAQANCGCLQDDCIKKGPVKQLAGSCILESHKTMNPQMNSDQSLSPADALIALLEAHQKELGLNDAGFASLLGISRPLGLEDKLFATFVPVLERLGTNDWLVGVAGEGLVKPLESVPPAQVIEQAQAIYVEWREAESQIKA